MRRLISLNEASKMVDLSYFQIARAVRTGRLKSELIGGRHFVRLSDVKKVRAPKLGRPCKKGDHHD